MALFKPIKGNTAKISGTPIKEGQMLYDFEANKIYIDIDSITRKEYTPAGVGGGVNYSTAEQDTGIKARNGRKIYQKTVTISGNVQSSFNHNIANFQTLVGVEMILNDHPMYRLFGTIASQWDENYEKEFVGFGIVLSGVDNSQIHIHRHNDLQAYNIQADVTLRYTCTNR